MSPSNLKPNDVFKFAVQDEAGNHLCWVEEDSARELVKKGAVRIIRRAGRVRMLIALDSTSMWAELRLHGHGTFGRTRYSHDRETATNPKGVWTLIKIPAEARSIFTAVLDECMAAA